MGKSSQPSNSTVTQTNLPEYAKPYVTDIYERAQTESMRPYEAYTGDRLADVSGTTQAGRDVITGLGTGIPGLGTAQDATSRAITGAEGIAGFQNPERQRQGKKYLALHGW